MFLDIVLLRTFVAVVEANGFTRAAGFVNLTQSAVSLHIKRLEEQVGRRLFDRTGPKLALTSDGEILLSYAQRILALEEEVKTRLGHPEPEGLVRFGAPEYFDPGTLASLLAQFDRRYPAIDLEIHMGIGTDIAALYGRGLLDVAIINREIDETDGADRSDNRLGEDIRVLYREGRVWAALRDMKLDSANGRCHWRCSPRPAPGDNWHRSGCKAPAVVGPSRCNPPGFPASLLRWRQDSRYRSSRRAA